MIIFTVRATLEKEERPPNQSSIAITYLLITIKILKTVATFCNLIGLLQRWVHLPYLRAKKDRSHH